MSTWSLVSSAWRHVKRKMHSCRSSLWVAQSCTTNHLAYFDHLKRLNHHSELHRPEIEKAIVESASAIGIKHQEMMLVAQHWLAITIFVIWCDPQHWHNAASSWMGPTNRILALARLTTVVARSSSSVLLLVVTHLWLSWKFGCCFYWWHFVDIVGVFYFCKSIGDTVSFLFFMF